MSSDLRRRAERVLAGGPGTFSKNPSRYPQGVAPFALTSGEGAYVTSDDGRAWLDTIGALGPIILGYGHPHVTEAVIQQVEHGTSFSMLHPLEVEVGEKLCELLPCAEMVRFARNGTDATNMACRIMRATGRKHIIFIGYHGGAADSYGVTTDKNVGILPELAAFNHQIAWDHFFTFGQLLGRYGQDLAGIMIEVPARPWGEPSLDIQVTLDNYATSTHAVGGMVCLDEVVTFPRWSLHGAQQVYGMTPDLCCVSKGIANGFPLAALVGKHASMRRLDAGSIFASWTFAGETTALAACKATLEVLETTEALDRIHTAGRQYGNGLADLFANYAIPAEVWGHPARLAVRWQDVPGVATKTELRTLWLQEHAKCGILLGIGVVFPNAAWTQHEVDLLLDAAQAICQAMQRWLAEGSIAERLECPLIEDVLSVR